MAELDELIAFTIEKYVANGGKRKSVIEKLGNCKSIKDLLKIRKRLGMMSWNNK